MEEIFHCKAGSSNKFWKYSLDSKTWTVTVEWGRVGSKPSKKTFKRYSKYSAESFISKKKEEKLKKGYKKIDKTKLKKEVDLAEFIGSKFKLDNLGFYNVQSQDADVLVLEPTDEFDTDSYVLVDFLDSWSKNRVVRLLSRSGPCYILLEKMANKKKNKMESYAYIGDTTYGLPEAIWTYLDHEVEKARIILKAQFGSHSGRFLSETATAAINNKPSSKTKETNHNETVLKKLVKMGGFGSLAGRAIDI